VLVVNLARGAGSVFRVRYTATTAPGLKAEFFAFQQSLTAPPALEGLTPKAVSYVTAINQPNPGAMFGDDPPRPGNWGGYRLVPHTWEFWQGRPSRLHDRLRYRLLEGDWVRERLAP